MTVTIAEASAPRIELALVARDPWQRIAAFAGSGGS